jgi:LacI family transcriptional regulator
MEDGIVRQKEYKRFLTEMGLPIREEWMAPGDFTIEGGYEGMKKILAAEVLPTAVFCANDEIAVGAIRAALEAGLNVPDDLSVVGFDNVSLAAVFLPAITTVRQPVQELASEATDALISLIEGEEAIASKILSTELIVRDSTSRPKEDPSP